MIEVTWGRVNRSAPRLLAAPVGLTFEDQLVGRRLQPVDCRVGQDWAPPAQPLDGFAVSWTSVYVASVCRRSEPPAPTTSSRSHVSSI